MDWELLEQKFYIARAHKPHAIYTVRGEGLLDQQEAGRLMKLYAELIKAKVPEAAGTYFCGWLGGLCAAVQYLLSHHHTALQLGLNNITLQLYLDEREKPSFAFVLHDETYDENTGDRDSWREAVLTRFYSQTVKPVIEALADAVRVDPSILWGVMPTGVYYRYEEMLQLAADNDTLSAQIKDDFECMVHGIQGRVFGRKKNPFHISFKSIPCWKNPKEQIRQKAGCCLYYQTEGGTYCYTCPRINAQTREQRKQELRMQYGLA